MICNYFKKHTKENIILYENYNKKIYFYDRNNEKAFSTDKKTLIDKMKNKITIDYEQNINLFSKQDKNEIIDELIINRVNDNPVVSKLAICLNDILCKLPVHNLILKIYYFFIIYLSLPIFCVGIIVCNNEILQFRMNELNKLIIITNFLIVLIGSIFIHEISHALIATYYGAFVPEIGVKFKNVNQNLCFPVFYTSIIGKSDIKKNNRIKILLAGPLSNFLLAGLSMIFFGVNNIIFFFGALLNIAMGFINLTTIFHTDAYFVVKEVLNYNDPNKTTPFKMFANKKISKKDVVYMGTIFYSLIIYVGIAIYVAAKVIVE